MGRKRFDPYEMRKGAEWACLVCMEIFPCRVVHCPEDSHHYPKEDGECSNCHESLKGLRNAVMIKRGAPCGRDNQWA